MDRSLFLFVERSLFLWKCLNQNITLVYLNYRNGGVYVANNSQGNNQLEAGLTEENALVLIESRTMRDQHVFRDEILEKVRILPTLPNAF